MDELVKKFIGDKYRTTIDFVSVIEYPTLINYSNW